MGTFLSRSIPIVMDKNSRRNTMNSKMMIRSQKVKILHDQIVQRWRPIKQGQRRLMMMNKNQRFKNNSQQTDFKNNQTLITLWYEVNINPWKKDYHILS